MINTPAAPQNFNSNRNNHGQTLFSTSSCRTLRGRTQSRAELVQKKQRTNGWRCVCFNRKRCRSFQKSTESRPTACAF